MKLKNKKVLMCPLAKNIKKVLSEMTHQNKVQITLKHTITKWVQL